MCSLAAHATDGWSNTFRGKVIGSDQLELWARGLEEFGAARAKYPQAQFLDVDYADFTADPVRTVASVYEHFGLDYSDAAAAAIRALHAEAAHGSSKPAHQYSLADFGLTGEQVDERFGGDTRG
jgi:LPS sulfotransferase NodH